MPKKSKIEVKKKRDWLAVFQYAGVLLKGLFNFMFFILILLLFFGVFSPPEIYPSGNILVVPVKGVLMSGGVSSSSVASSTDIVKYLKYANETSSVKGIILEIDSPGGSPLASEEVASFIQKIDKPVVSVIKSSGASGAYWIASSTDRIYASRFSITGSIGVTSSYLEFAGLLKDYNVTYRRLVAGKYKDAGSPLKELSDEEAKLYQKIIDSIYDDFVEVVARNRKLDVAYVKNLSTGFVFLGDEAVTLGLVDEIGDRETAVAYLAKELDISPEVGEFKVKQSFWESFGVKMDSAFYSMGKGVGEAIAQPKIVS